MRCIDNHIKQQAEPGQQGCQQIGCQPQDQERAYAEQKPEYDSVTDSDDAGHEGSVGGAAHLAVYVPVQHHVEYAGTAGGHVSANEDSEQGQPGRKTAGGHEHGAHCGEK